MLRTCLFIAASLAMLPAAHAQTATSCARPPCSFTTTTTAANGQTSTTTGTAIKTSSGQWTMQTQTSGQTGVSTSGAPKHRR